MDRRRSLWRAAQAAFVVAVLWYAARLLGAQWSEVRELRATVVTDWTRIVGASVLVLLSYAVLIATWLATVRAWGERLGAGEGAFIWFVSNLGRYLPGKVWQVGAMGVLAQRAGVSAVAAVGSAVVVSLVHVLVGFAVVGLTGRELLAEAIPSGPWLVVALLLMAGAVIAAPWTLAPLVRTAARLTGRALTPPALPPRATWVAALGSAVAWMLFGLAFRLLAAALLGEATGDAFAYIAVFTLSYLLGFLALFAPGGIGVRELSLAALLVAAGLTTEAQAAWLVVGSRLWLTVLEILPGAALLLWRPFRTLIPTSSS